MAEPSKRKPDDTGSEAEAKKAKTDEKAVAVVDPDDEDDEDDDEDDDDYPVFKDIDALMAFIRGKGKDRPVGSLHSAIWGDGQIRGSVKISSAFLSHLTGAKAGPLVRVTSLEYFGLPVEFERAVDAALRIMAGPPSKKLLANVKTARKAWFESDGKKMVAELICAKERKFHFFVAFADDD